MRQSIFIALFLITIAYVSAECDIEGGFIPVTFQFTGDVFGAVRDTDQMTLSFNVVKSGGDVSLDDITAAGLCYVDGDSEEIKYCPSRYISVKELFEGSLKYNYCMKSIDSDTGRLVKYSISVSGITNRGWCVSMKPTTAKENIYYFESCPEVTSTSDISYFYVDSQVAAPINSLLLNPKVTDSDKIYPVIYVDKYNDMEIRPSLSLQFTKVSNTDSTAYGIYPLSFDSDLDFAKTFDYDKFIFTGKTHIEDNNDHLLTVSHTTSDISQSISIILRSVECEAGQYPVIFSRHYNIAESGVIECYILNNNDNSESYSTCPGGAWEYTGTDHISKNSVIHEHYACLSAGEYFLTLQKVDTSNKNVNDNWIINSFLSIIALSHKEENVNFIGYTIGDFGYTATYDVEHHDENTNVARINVGPIVCNEGERVVIFQKYSTVFGGAEGFEVKGEQSTTTLSFFGSANLDQRRFDPLYKVFVCLTGDNYSVKLISKPYIDPVSHADLISCGSWSTVKSVESVEYTTLDNVSVNAIHPSFLRIEILNTNSYSGGIVENAETIIEGENIAVFGTDRTHIANPYCASHPIIPETDIYDQATGGIHYDCHYDLAVQVTSPASYTISDNDVVVGINSISKYINDPANIKIECQDQTEGECTYIEDYTITCHATTADAINNENAVPCSSYGLTFINSGINAGATGNFATPKPVPDEFHIRIVSNIKSDYTVTKSSITSYIHYNLNEAIDQCSLFFIKQGESVDYLGITVDPENVVCTLNGLELSSEQVIVTKNAASMNLLFTISSYDLITCLIADKSILVYSEPSCKTISESFTYRPLYQNRLYDTDEYQESCNGDHQSFDIVCVYDPLTLKASIQVHETVCHILSGGDIVPPGHGYVKATFSIVAESYPDVNAVAFPSWFKRFIEDAFENASRVPLRNAYVTGIRYTSNDEAPNVELDMVFDTAYEYTTDFINYLTENTATVDAVNLKLENSIPGYFTTHKLVLGETDYESTPNMCAEVTDTEGFEYEFYDETTHSPVVHTYEGAVWKETIIWYYAYNAVPLPDNNVDPETPYDTEHNRFWGAFTRYCKPKYYEAYFLSVNTLSAAQTNVLYSNSIFLTVRITNLDPRSVGTETRYLVARALDRYVINHSSNGAEKYAELFDINVHMIEGHNPVDENADYYKDTIFYVQVRVRSNVHEQFETVIENLQSVVTNNESCTVQEEVADSMILFMGNHFGDEWRANQKDVFICFYPNWDTSNTYVPRNLRY